MELVKEDLVEFKLAKAAANNPTDFDLKMNTFGDADSKQPEPSAGGNMADEMSQLFGS
jgi:hypothetical protein